MRQIFASIMLAAPIAVGALCVPIWAVTAILGQDNPIGFVALVVCWGVEIWGARILQRRIGQRYR